MIFWVHNLRPSLDGMRPARHRKSPTNGTPNSLQATVIKDFRPGLQIRPRRFDSGFGLHLRKPRRPWSTGFFYGWDLMIASSTFWIASATFLFSVRDWRALSAGIGPRLSVCQSLSRSIRVTANMRALIKWLRLLDLAASLDCGMRACFL